MTGLRFFAAIAIVVLHLNVYGLGFLEGVPLTSAVSFFFILSGFILAHRYPALETKQAVLHFLVARAARIWPVHLVVLLILFFLPQGAVTPVESPWLLLSNATLTQAWIPFSNSYFSYNNVSWSISVEAFFYLAFPLLIASLAQTWWWKLPCTLAITFALIAISTYLGLGSFTSPDWSLTATGLIYANPLARLFEFTLGMCICLASRAAAPFLKLSYFRATLLEIAALALVFANAWVARPFNIFVGSQIGFPARQWLGAGATMTVSFAVILIVFSQQRGALSRATGSASMVFVGEISFSIYMLHYVILRFYFAYRDFLPEWSGAVMLVLFFVVLFASSFLMWKLVESPARSLIVNGYRRYGRLDVGTSVHEIRPGYANSRSVGEISIGQHSTRSGSVASYGHECRVCREKALNVSDRRSSQCPNPDGGCNIE
nr:acyltransferase [Bradyrhizobium diazoefficiens]